jgi:hypothetical protein
MGHKGHYGEYSGNAKWSRDHAHTKVTKENYDATKRDDEAHMQYLKEDVDYDDKHGHSDEKMTADEKHISKLAGDLKYDEKHHGSPAHATESPLYKKPSGTKPKPQSPPDSPVYQEKKMMMTKKLECMPGYIRDNKGKCVPVKRTKPEEKIRT